MRCLTRGILDVGEINRTLIGLSPDLRATLEAQGGNLDRAERQIALLEESGFTVGPLKDQIAQIKKMREVLLRMDDESKT